MTTDTVLVDWPTRFAGLTGLQEGIQRNDVPHAMLFLGRLADTSEFIEYLAKVLLCLSVQKPCGTCASCRQFDALSHPDFVVADALDGGRLKTGDVEALQARLKTRAHHGGKLIYVIYHMEAATPVSANRLLKTLEEPANQVVALLAAPHISAVMPTVLSRCFTYRLDRREGKFEDESTSTLLEGFPETENHSFAAIFPSMVKWTEDLLINHVPPLLLADAWVKVTKDVDAGASLHILSVWFRDVMHITVGNNQDIHFVTARDLIQRQASFTNPAKMARAIELVLQAKTRLKSNVQVQLNMEQLCIRLQEVIHDVQRRGRSF